MIWDAITLMMTSLWCRRHVQWLNAVKWLEIGPEGQDALVSTGHITAKNLPHMAHWLLKVTDFNLSWPKTLLNKDILNNFILEWYWMAVITIYNFTVSVSTLLCVNRNKSFPFSLYWQGLNGFFYRHDLFQCAFRAWIRNYIQVLWKKLHIHGPNSMII